MTDEKKKNEHKTDKHHGQAGDGNDLIPIKADGTPAKYDKYGNLVTENTGKGKGIMLKQSYQTASKNIAAPSPAEIAYGLTRPYWSINMMPIEYVYNSVIRYFNSIIEPKYERIPVVDEEGEPLLDDDGKTILHTVLTSYIYKNTPTKYGLAQALGVELSTLNNYLRAETVHADSNIDYTGMNSKNKFEHLAITTDGFAYYDNETLTHCSTQHAYGNWVVTKEVSCAEDGQRHRTCTICNHVESETVLKGQHTYDFENATVVTDRKSVV